MATSTMTEPEVRTYGGWRRSRGIGLLGLGPVATFIVLGGTVIVLATAAFSLITALYMAIPVAVAATVAIVRWDGVPLSHAVLERVRFWWGHLRGHTSWRGGVVVDHPHAFELPGVLSPIELVSAEDGRGGTYGVAWDRRSGMLTATLRCAASSTWLADRGDADTWVANWGSWMASLGHMPSIRWVAVTVDTAPDSGSTLDDYVASRLDPDAPAAARHLMAELVRQSPSAAAAVDTRVSITFDPTLSPAKPKELPDALAEFSRTLYGLTSALGSCGLTVLGRATAPELVGMVRTAFDPAHRGEVERALGNGDTESLLTWADAGPISAEEYRDYYEHDSGLSVSWAWHEAPRQAVHSDVLARLVSPGMYPKRVTLLYRPFSAGDAARTLEGEVNAAVFRAEVARRQGRDATARDLADQNRAQQAAREEAMGSGVCLMSMFLTVTVESEQDLPIAVADVEARVETAKIRLRRLWRSQAAGFAATLPLGICPPALSRRWPR